MRNRRYLIVARLLAALVGAVALVGPGAGAAGTTVALWRMDEPAGATIMYDSVGGHDGTLTDVRTGVAGGVSGTAYGFNGHSSKAVVPSSGGFSIGSSNLAFTVHVKFANVPSTTVGDYDLLRGTPGGAYRLEIVARKDRTMGVASCFFSGSAGRAVLTAGPTSPTTPGTRSSAARRPAPSSWWRSEEHTSELQSRVELVCRLLLEKKKK